MNDLDKWAAEVCGINGLLEDGELYVNAHDIWTLSDARCMAIFREKFDISTTRESTIDYNYKYGTQYWCAQSPDTLECKGRTIEEAELKCAELTMINQISLDGE